MTTDTLAKLAADFVPRLLAVVKIYQEQAALGIAVDAELFGAVSRLVAAQALPAAEPTRPANSQQWAGMDGATAFQLIERHADGWADIALMMSEWLAANQAAQQAAQATAGWVLVPVEPTAAMLAAVVSSMDEHLLGKEAEKQYRDDWAAMLAARPALQQPQPQSAQESAQ